jgi:plasmid stabilization system protein ParE
MMKRIFWSLRALKDLEKITRFNTSLFCFEKAIAFALEITKSTDIIESSNFSGIDSTY